MGVNLSATLPPLLEARGMTQAELAIRTGIRRTDINALVNGRVEAGPSRLQRIAAALEVSELELGASEQANGDGLSRLEALEAQVHAHSVSLDAARRTHETLRRRVLALEHELKTGQQPRTQPAQATQAKRRGRQTG